MTKLPTDEAVYFADATHEEHQTKPAFGSVRKGSNSAVKTTTGRGRVNIHGAVCLKNFDVPFVEPVTVDGDSAVQLLAKIEANQPSKSLIRVIWDNAAYHRCAAVKKWLSRPKCRIHLIQLPTYCPACEKNSQKWKGFRSQVSDSFASSLTKTFGFWYNESAT